jgi:aspartyl/glutamyl-tRNA(Asn/Gln) amidotransferase C subunit
MIKPEELDAIAELSRIDLKESEKEKLRHDIESIVAYISQLQTAPALEGEVSDTFIPKNVLREDEAPHESGAFTEAIVAQAPERKGNYIVVKKIL